MDLPLDGALGSGKSFPIHLSGRFGISEKSVPKMTVLILGPLDRSEGEAECGAGEEVTVVVSFVRKDGGRTAGSVPGVCV